MKPLIFFVLVLGLAGCGGRPGPDARFSQNRQPNAGQLTISGFVSLIQIATAGTNLGPNSVVTQVTFTSQIPQASPLATITFCGDVSKDFVLDAFATVNFTQQQGCDMIVGVKT